MLHLRLLPQIPRAGIQRLANLRELDARGKHHNSEQRFGEAGEQADQGLAADEAEDHLDDAEDDDGGATAGAETVLGSEAAGAVARGHGAEPAADEVHNGDGGADGGDGGGRDAWEEVGGEMGHGDDGVEGS